LKASLGVRTRQSLSTDLLVYPQKVKLVDVVDRLPGKLSNLMSVQRLERGEAANIKRLEKVRGVGWHTQSDDLVVYTELIKLWCSMAPMTVKYEQSPRPNSTRLCVFVEVLYPLKTKLVCCPPVVTNSDSPV
jgi:hypothetical protein